ncbi:terpene synthase family protein [Streptomyces sp. NPDC092296]|uniref:terpene synthase family protein n=1 Tax=Streptomyces sp. NPDC092296 TaxID=3366012 RepID=UPI00382A79B7
MGPGTTRARGHGVKPPPAAAALLARVRRPEPHDHADAVREEIGAWLAASRVLGDSPRAFLAQGHLDLVARAWGDVPRGPRLAAAAKWLVLTWILDDHFDDQWIGRPTAEARRTVRALADLLGDGREDRLAPGARTAPDPAGDEDALVGAFAALWRETAGLTTPLWRARYATHFRAYLDASLGYLEAGAPEGPVPTVPEYLHQRDRDGAVLCAAGWVELAHGLDISDEAFRHPQVADVLMRFNHVICWANDLYSAPAECAAGNGKNLLRSLAVHEGLAPGAAAVRLGALCEAELATFEFLADGIARGPSWPEEVRVLARALIRFTHALIRWTATAARYRMEAAP